ncbi:MAG: peptidase M14 [Alteromonadaceae bacterium]|nr:peptidase M14 [Alteromonadaceae bacterium]
MKTIFPVLLLIIALSQLGQAVHAKQYNADIDYFANTIEFDSAIPTPEDVLGNPVGTWHVRPDQIVNYMQALAKASDKVNVVEIGRSHENRPLIHVFITSAKNHANLESIQAQHLKNWNASGDNTVAQDAPVIVNMGYSIHGNESSGSNAALLVAYYLAAAKSEDVTELLKNTVIIIDPSLNPDGLSRFAHWANSHRGKTLVTDPANREHNQHWPSARTNHYWFDLNRDWLLLTHPESRARVEQFQKWRPHVLTDFHEMGSHSTYFFQPGVATRNNPNTDAELVELTTKIADFHAAALDDQGELYFTGEAFDDFYYGKGSSYPDAQGTVGILFEQASSRGHLRETRNGLLSFPETIANQVTTSLSTFAAVNALRKNILEHQQNYLSVTMEKAKKDKISGFLVKAGKDKVRMQEMLDILQSHQIKIFPLVKDYEFNDVLFSAGNAYFVPLQQPQYRLVKSLFSNRKSFQDNTFYDVSNWNIAHAFNVEYSTVSGSRWNKIPYNKDRAIPNMGVENSIDTSAVAVAFNWYQSTAPKLLQSLLSMDIDVRVSAKAFTAKTNQGEVDFLSGAVVIPRDSLSKSMVPKILAAADSAKVKLWNITSGLTPRGIDLGSRNVQPLETPDILLVVGRGMSQYEVGEIWHYLDTYLSIPVSLIDRERLGSADLSRYSHMIFADGNYKSVNESTVKKIDRWLKTGGVLIGQKRAGAWFADNSWLNADFIDQEDIEGAFDTSSLRYDDMDALSAKQRIAGAVFETKVDLSHPLLFGFERKTLPVFKNRNVIMRNQTKPFLMPIQFTTNPLKAGYTADEMQKLVANSGMAVAHNKGKGKVIYFSDNLNFRGYWRGTRRLMSNAIYFSQFIDVAD